MNPYKPKITVPNPKDIAHIQDILHHYALTTVCEESACPNRGRCYAKHSATFMILGDTCTRACRFCNVKTGAGMPVDSEEPQRLARAIKALALDYVVITSVDRDDLKDYGAGHFVACVEAIRHYSPNTKIELLTPDFRANPQALECIIEAKADKLAHNQETIARLSPTLRPQSSYTRSLQTLSFYATHTNIPIKSSLMLGLGESREELIETMQDLLEVGVSQLTLGQYLQPSSSHFPVAQYHPQSTFDSYKTIALEMGFKRVASGILVRSSYEASLL